MGTRNNAGECAAVSEAHLPFAGITLFRFNGCDLSLSANWRKSTPGFKSDSVKQPGRLFVAVKL